jgi:hypothetical protein
MAILSRRRFCASAPALLALPAFAAGDDHGILVTSAQAAKLRAGVVPALVRQNAVAARKAGPWSVTTERPEILSAGPNDYYSEGPYWWPDPKNPKGPYIRKDGERNPRRFQANRRDLGDMCSAVLALGMGAYLLGDRPSGEHVASILSAWFLDPKAHESEPGVRPGGARHQYRPGHGADRHGV